MKRILVSLISISLCWFSVLAQQTRIDSLLQKVKYATDKEKLILYTELSELYRDISTPDSDNFGTLAYNLGKDMDAGYGIMKRICRSIAETSFIQWRFKRAIDFYEEELYMIGEGVISADVATLYFKLGNSYNKWNRKRRALEYYEKSIKIAKELGLHFLLLQNYIELYTLYASTNNNQLAFDYYELYVELYNTLKFPDPKRDTVQIVDTVVKKLVEQVIKYKTKVVTEETNNQDEILYLDSALSEAERFQRSLIDTLEKNELKILLLSARKVLDEQELEIQKQELDSKSKEVNQKNRILLIFIVSVLILLALITVIIILLWQKQKTNTNLMRSEENLKELNAMKDKFFSIIAHDLKNPLHILLLTTDILTNNFDDYAPDKIRTYVENMNKSSQVLANLLENLLTWSRSQLGAIDFEPVSINIDDLSDEIIVTVQPNADKKNITIEKDINKNICIRADRNMISVVLRNLLSNAIKFTPENGIITVHAFENDNNIICGVKDNGIGITDEDKEKLFRMDVQHTTKGTDEEQGTGLGLLLCREFVQKHSGNIWVNSAEGYGSDFQFSVPKCIK